MRKLILVVIGSLFVITQVQSQSREGSYIGSVKVEITDTPEQIISKAANLRPTERQLDALNNEFIAFIHFGPNTFTRREWGTGMEDPKVFDLKELHTDEWCQTMKAAGMKMAILTVKHHDGFCLWQTRYTKHGIMSTDYQDGKGDILKELAASCKKYGIKLGIYLSPADLYQIESPEGIYGNLSQYTKRTIPRDVPGRPFKNKTKFEFEVDDYNEYFLNQLFELLTEYGPIYEVWFDGAHPKTKGGQKYNYPAWRELIRTLAPQAIIFGREDARWCGNEGGSTREAEFNVVTYQEDPSMMKEFYDMYGELGSRTVYESKEKPFYLHYEPAETNTSIRAGWFFSDDEHQEVRTADDVFDIYERSVGGNSIFLLNIPPTREGRFSERDAEVLREVGRRIRDTYDNNLLKGAKGPKQVLDNKQETYTEVGDGIVISTPEPVTINRISLREPIGTVGERVERHAVDAFVDGKWKEVAQGTNIGNRRILRFPDVTTSKIRIRVLETRAVALISEISAYHYNTRPPQITAIQNIDGTIRLEPFYQTMHWWSYRASNGVQNINSGYKIFYTLDGTDPTSSSNLYMGPFPLENSDIKAVAILGEEKGPVYEGHIGLSKKGWKVISYSSQNNGQPAKNAIDADASTNWQSGQGKSQYISIDLGKSCLLKGFSYTPHAFTTDGMIEKGIFSISMNGADWTDYEEFEFGNLINDPTRRSHYFNKPVETRFIQIKSLRIAGDGNSVGMAELGLF